MRRKKGLGSNPVRRKLLWRKAFRSEEYVQAVERMPCAVPTCRTSPCHAHHVPTRGAGGTWRDLAPLCPKHHREWHDIGEKTFDARHGVHLRAIARTVYSTLSDKTE